MIGAFVDHNKCKGATMRFATAAGMRTARLPLDEPYVHFGQLYADYGAALRFTKDVDEIAAEVADADFVIEAAPEQLALKQAIFADLEKAAPRQVLKNTITPKGCCKSQSPGGSPRPRMIMLSVPLSTQSNASRAVSRWLPRTSRTRSMEN